MNGGKVHIADERYRLVSLHEIAWSQIWRVQLRLSLQTIPYDAETLWCEAWNTLGIFSGMGIEKMKRSEKVVSRFNIPNQS